MVLLIYTGLTKEVINSIDTVELILFSIDTKCFRSFNYLELLSRIMLTKLSFDVKLHKLMLLLDMCAYI